MGAINKLTPIWTEIRRIDYVKKNLALSENLFNFYWVQHKIPHYMKWNKYSDEKNCQPTHNYPNSAWFQ